jgi:hypothetical protein
MRCQATTPQEQDDFPFPSAATPRTVAVDGFLANQDDYQITLSGGPGAGAVGTPLYTLQFRYHPLIRDSDQSWRRQWPCISDDASIHCFD